MVTLKKSDIGAEIISILTRGIYTDPRDALREYVQNGVDARAKNIFIKIRHKTIVVEDDGEGMDYTIMRKSIRLGVSDKNPKKAVGFLGIGIYSSFHLCNNLTIYSKVKNKSPNKLSFDFKSMRILLDQQKAARFSNKPSEQLLALQSLLEDHITLKILPEKEFPKVGTRVEMEGIDSEFFKSLSQFKEVADYLEQVVPLPFNPRFRWAKKIENKINEICREHGAIFNLINLTLQINEESAKLYRPYDDNLFEPNPLAPLFYPLKEGKDFFGIAWGCLNSSRRSIKNTGLRGFIIKRGGFSLGTRERLLTYFKRQIFYNRYVGEVIVVHHHLLPNAPRTDFEFSPLRISFYDCISSMSSYFNGKANDHQEFGKSDEEINYIIDYIKETKAQLNYFMDNGDKLLQILHDLIDFKSSLQGREKRGYIKKEREKDFDRIISEIKNLSKEIRLAIENQKKRHKSSPQSEEDIAKEIKKMPKKTSIANESKINSLVEVFDLLGIKLSIELRSIFELFDEQFIQSSSTSKEDYVLKLKNLKKDIEELLED